MQAEVARECTTADPGSIRAVRGEKNGRTGRFCQRPAHGRDTESERSWQRPDVLLLRDLRHHLPSMIVIIPAGFCLCNTFSFISKVLFYMHS
jgi:hypothetical protein